MEKEIRRNVQMSLWLRMVALCELERRKVPLRRAFQNMIIFT